MFFRVETLKKIYFAPYIFDPFFRGRKQTHDFKTRIDWAIIYSWKINNCHYSPFMTKLEIAKYIYLTIYKFEDILSFDMEVILPFV